MMFKKEIEIQLYNSKEKVSEMILVEQLSENSYKALENDVFSLNLTFGTEFETRINEKGQHEIVRILKNQTILQNVLF